MAQRRILLSLVCLGLLAATVAGLVRLRVDTSIESFLPADDPAYQALEEKAESFGGDPVVVVLESGKPAELLLEKGKLLALLKLEGDLARVEDVASVYGPATVLNQTAGAAQDLLAQISGRRDGLRITAEQRARAAGATPSEVTAAGERAVARFDRRYGALLVQGMPAGLPTLNNPQFVRTVMLDDNGRPRPQWQFLVPDASSVAILVRPRAGLDQEATAELVDDVRGLVDDADLGTARTTVTGVPVLGAALTEDARGEAPVLGALSLVLVGLVFLLVPWSRRRRDRIRPVVAALAATGLTLAAFGWLDHPLSLGVVAFLPILLGIGSDYPFYLARTGGSRSVVVAALAGAAGFASLALSPIQFVQELGLALAIGILATLAVGLAMTRLLGPVRSRPDRTDPHRPRLASTRQRAAVLAVAGLSAAAGWLALPGLSVEGQPEELAQGVAELDDAEHAEQLLGSSGEISIRLRGDDLTDPQVLAWTRQARERLVLELGDQVRPILSLADLFAFLGDDPEPAQVDAALEIMPDYLTSAVLERDRSEALMVFGVKIRDVNETRTLIRDIERALPPPPSGVEVELVGLPVAAAHGLDLVSDDGWWMNLAGIGLALVVLAVGLRSRADVARAALTMVLSTGWIAGVVALTTGTLNPLTVAIGSLATATSCEFAIMLARTGGRGVLRGVGTAAVAALAGYAVLALSELAVLREFGLLLAASVACSFVAAGVAVVVVRPRRQQADPRPVSSSTLLKEVALV